MTSRSDYVGHLDHKKSVQLVPKILFWNKWEDVKAAITVRAVKLTR